MRRISRGLLSTCSKNVRTLSVLPRRLTATGPAAINSFAHTKFQSLQSPLRPTFRMFSSLPPHNVVGMPSLSPTMESGSIAKWNLKEGDRFEAGTSICEVETDKATVTYEATDEGYLAKILVGSGEVKVGAPLMITVEDKDSVSAFANFDINSVKSGATPTKTVTSSSPAPAAVASAPTPVAATPASTLSSASGRVAASPLARKLARESGKNLAAIRGTGPNGRIIAVDVMTATHAPVAASTTAETAATVSATVSSAPAAARPQPVVAALPVNVGPSAVTVVPGAYSDAEISSLARAVAQRQTASKQLVPHYYLSIELDLTSLLKLRGELNAKLSSQKNEKSAAPVELSVQDFLVKAAAMAMKQVPDVNGSWMETFVRRYEQVDINLVMGSGAFQVTPVVRDCASKGLHSIAKEVAEMEDTLFADNVNLAAVDAARLQPGTFTIHNLGIYGVKTASPIILPPQACALALGAIADTVVPNVNAKEGEENWRVAPVMTVTLSCDHRVVDGAVGAQWLQSFKALVEQPITMIL